MIGSYKENLMTEEIIRLLEKKAENGVLSKKEEEKIETIQSRLKINDEDKQWAELAKNRVCGECRFWERWEDKISHKIYKKWSTEEKEKRQNKGFCSNYEKIYDSYEGWKIYEDKADCISAIGDDFESMLLGEKFGCIHFDREELSQNEKMSQTETTA